MKLWEMEQAQEEDRKERQKSKSELMEEEKGDKTFWLKKGMNMIYMLIM